MRTEVKIGIAVALFIAIVVVGYLVLSNAASGPEGTETAGEPEPQPDRAPAPSPRVDELPTRDEAEFALDDSEEDTAPATEPDDEPIPLDGESLPADGRDDDAVTDALLAGLDEEEAEPVDEPEPIEPYEPYEADASLDAEDEYAGGSIDDVPSASPTEPYGPSRARTYTVKEGDAGFWTVSVKVYGNGKHWKRIQDANSDADTRRLRPGQKLIIPPLEDVRTEADEPRRTTAGSGEYVVTKDDTQGFWGIAKKLYGDATLHTVLSEANPDINPRRLHAGQVIRAPQSPRGPTEGADGAEAAGGEIIREAGRRYYVVASGDAGFWGVADKVYGDGKYMDLVRAVNPDADPRALRAGQRLEVPELTEARRREYGRAAPSEPVEIPEELPGRFPRPDFGG
ncbi:MAG: LysM peptidoglycan-binding domain-containing protein [Planctomycetota bacterium]